MRAINAGAYPYCSLDPYPENISTLQSLANKTQNINSINDIKTFFHDLESTIGPQQVVVGGVPRNSRHAHIMIDADYHMKKVSQGHITLSGVTSYLDNYLNDIKNEISSGKMVAPMGVSMARFWFHTGNDSPTFLESEGTVWIDKCSVVVLTEKQMSNSEGQLYDIMQDDSHATAFANELSKNFSDLTKTVLVYADLENLFRLRALLLSLELRNGLSIIGFDFNTYLKEYKFQYEKIMEKSLPGLANYREWSQKVQSGNMISEYFLFPMVCGGVGMDMQINSSNFSMENSKKLPSLRTAILKERPSKKSLSWTISEDN